MLIIFDVIGTLFSLDRARSRFEDERLSRELFDLWFEKILQTAMAATLADRYSTFKEISESTLRQIFMMNAVSEKKIPVLLHSLDEIEPREDAGECLKSLRSDGHHLVALTNSGVAATEQKLQRAGLRDFFEALYSADEVKACKPHPAPYTMVFKHLGVEPADCYMVAAHGWDIIGASSVGLRTIYVSQMEKQWPFPGEPPDLVAANLAEVSEMISSRAGIVSS